MSNSEGTDSSIRRRKPRNSCRHSLPRKRLPVALLALGDHLASCHIQSGKQGRRAMANVVVRDALRVTKTHGQKGLGSIESLDLGLLVDAQDEIIIWGIEVKADDVAADLLHKERIRRDFVALRLPRSGTFSAGTAAE
jgi:hypothetical protein